MSKEKKGLFRWVWGLVFSGFGLAFVLGIVFWGGFNWALEETNKESFCITCHEMRDFVYQEYRETIHYQNRTGVRATCPDCHVPKEWVPKMIRKIKASRELYGKIMGTINTPEKFAAYRIKLAESEWKRMKANNSQECRNCHDYTYFDYSMQSRRSGRMHQTGFEEGQTCIDCHKGIAHHLPPIEQNIGADNGGVETQIFHPAAGGQ